jgi:cytosine/adenosine deaminase-related metal-dependent hydrolase
LLTNSKLDLEKLDDIDFAMGTDGLSSNNSLNMFDELRNALMIHEHHNINELGALLLKAVTKNGAKALGLNKGVLKESFDSDMIVLQLPHGIEDETSLASHVILHTKQAKKVIIGGKNVQIF